MCIHSTELNVFAGCILVSFLLNLNTIVDYLVLIWLRFGLNIHLSVLKMAKSWFVYQLLVEI